MILRDYQREAVDNIKTMLLDGSHKSVLAVLATGLGKTVIAAHVMKEWPYGRRIMAAHRDELIQQMSETLKYVVGELPALEKSKSYACNDKESLFKYSDYVATSIQTQNYKYDNGRYRMERFDPSDFGLLFYDEGHRGVAQSYKRMTAHYMQNEDCRMFGVTATPDRADEVALAAAYQGVAYKMELLDAVEKGWLVMPDQMVVEVQGMDFSKAGLAIDGDLRAGDLDHIIKEERNLHGIAGPISDIAAERGTQGLVFVPSVESAHLLADVINRRSPGMAAALDGTMRSSNPTLFAQTLQAFRQGDLQVLVNVELFTEGFDCPGVEWIGMARPTKSRAKFSQAIGRSTRVLPGVIESKRDEKFWRLEDPADRLKAIANSKKPRALVIEFTGNSGKHRLQSTGSVLGGKYPDIVIQKAQEIARDKEGAVDVQEVLEEAKEAIARNDYKDRQLVIADVKYRMKKATPFERYGVKPPVEPVWHKGRKASDRQLAALRKFGIEVNDRPTFCEASSLMDTAVKRRKADLASYRQIAVIQNNGHMQVEGKPLLEVSFSEASKFIDHLSKSWKKKPYYRKKK